MDSLYIHDAESEKGFSTSMFTIKGIFIFSEFFLWSYQNSPVFLWVYIATTKKKVKV